MVLARPVVLAIGVAFADVVGVPFSVVDVIDVQVVAELNVCTPCHAFQDAFVVFSHV